MISRVSAIIPVFNESQTIANVLDCVISCELIDEIVVINDGSTDNSREVIELYDVQLINLPQNRGKGYALNKGMELAKGDIILFLDSDLLGLKHEHVSALIKPVISFNADMTIGAFSSGRVLTTWAHAIAPFLSGQRAVKKSALIKCGDFSSSGYGVETQITLLFRKYGFNTQIVELPQLTHVMKEEKLGLIKGLLKRFKMYYEILKVLMGLHN